jgi:hypothetical protein
LQALIDLIAGFIALLAAAALSQFGVDLHKPGAPDREVRRVIDCPQAPSRSDIIASPSEHC